VKSKSRRQLRRVDSSVSGVRPSSFRSVLALLTDERWRIGILVAAAAVLAAVSFDPKLDTWGDNALFIILGRSIATGQGMRDISQPNAPPSGYAFGFPAMLAIIEWLSPGNHLAEKLLVVGWFLLAIPLLYLLARDVVGPGPALWTAVLTASNPVMLRWSNQVMTEMPFLSVSLLALLLLGRAMAKGDRPLDPLFVGSLAAILLAMTIRSAGLVLALAAPVSILIRRRYRLLAAILLLLIAAMTGAIVAGYGPVLWTYVPRLFGPLSEAQTVGGGLENLMWRAKTNIWRQVFINIPVMILPFPGAWLAPRLLVGLRYLLALIVLSLLVVGLGRMLRRSEPWAVYTGLYLLAIVIWEPGLAIMRGLVPVVPFLFLSIVVGAMPVLAWGHQRWPKGSPWLRSGLVGLVFAVIVWGNIDFVQTFRDYPPQWQSYFEAASWIEQHTSPESIVAARKPSLLYLTSKRRSIFPPYSPSPEEFLERLRRSHATHVIVDQLGFRETGQLLVPAIRRYPDIFRPVYITISQPPTYVVEIHWPEAAAFSR
jgi:hypothetical protein